MDSVVTRGHQEPAHQALLQGAAGQVVSGDCPLKRPTGVVVQVRPHSSVCGPPPVAEVSGLTARQGSALGQAEGGCTEQVVPKRPPNAL